MAASNALEDSGDQQLIFILPEKKNMKETVNKHDYS